MHQTNSVTVGLDKLLYGREAPHLLMKRYTSTDDELYHDLWSVPETPWDYLTLLPDMQRRWQQHLDAERLKQWIPPFYALSEERYTPFHPLCKYYLSFIRCECRMVIQSVAVWTETLELTLLRYELVILQQSIIELLKECMSRLDQGSSERKTLQGRLEHFMLHVFRDHLLALLYEQQDRYGHLLEERSVDPEQLWLRYLHRPVPEEQNCFRTDHYTAFHLEKALRGDGNRLSIEHMLAETYREYRHADRSIRQILLPSIHRLENCWLCYRLCMETGEAQPYELNDSENNERKIREWLESLQQEADDRRHELLFRLPEVMEQADNLIHTGCTYEASEAVRLLRELYRVFDRAAESVGVQEGATVYANPGAGSQVKHHRMLDDLISVNDILEKLDVHINTLNRYIEQSGVKVIRFSAKSRWMLRDDFKRFLDANREVNKEKNM